MSVITDKNRIEKLFERNIVRQIFPSQEFLMEQLTSGKRLRIYIGVDPTSTAMHLSHAKNFLFLEELRQLGHEVIVLVGDFTARIGDPSDRHNARKQLSSEEIAKNVALWIPQIQPWINLNDPQNSARIAYNNQWLNKLTLHDIVDLASSFTVQQMLERDMFEKRWNEEIPIYLHEFLYPLMQGYDSVALDVDIELCGTDQIFNALAGRTLLKRLKNKEKSVLSLNLMENPVTGTLMSKSSGIGVFLNTNASEMYGAIMAQPDEMIEILFLNCTRIPLYEKNTVLNLGPRNAKAHVAYDIVKRVYGEDEAHNAQQTFTDTFSEKKIPRDIRVVKSNTTTPLIESLIAEGIVSSKSEWRRLVREGAVRTEHNERIDDVMIKPTKSLILKIGKRRFVRVEI